MRDSHLAGRPRAGERWTRIGSAFAFLAGALIVVVTQLPAHVDATSIVPFTPRFTANENGTIAVFGNNLMVCPANAADCAGARAGTNTRNNNNFNMVHLDVDGATFPTFSSSSADVVLPADAEVRWAGLYWVPAWAAAPADGGRGTPPPLA